MSGVVNALLNAVEQSFSTLPVSIAGNGVALYALSIRSPGNASAPVPGFTYLFPMSPQGVRKETPALNAIYDVQGPPNTGGVTRMVDMWGQAPPMYVLRGTTGWKRHSTDGFALSGKASLVAIQTLLSQFAMLNQQQMQQQATTFYTLELYDYWTNEFWQVVPVGPQGIEQGADRPIMGFYTFRFAAIQPVNSPIPPLAVDALVSLLSLGAQQATVAFDNFSSNVISKYA